MANTRRSSADNADVPVRLLERGAGERIILKSTPPRRESRIVRRHHVTPEGTAKWWDQWEE